MIGVQWSHMLPMEIICDFPLFTATHLQSTKLACILSRTIICFTSKFYVALNSNWISKE